MSWENRPCRTLEQRKWAAVQDARLLPGIPYFLITLTVPDPLRGTCKRHPAIPYARGRGLKHHPHVHLVISVNPHSRLWSDLITGSSIAAAALLDLIAGVADGRPLHGVWHEGAFRFSITTAYRWLRRGHRGQPHCGHRPHPPRLRPPTCD